MTLKSSISIWFQLVNKYGEPYNDTSPDRAVFTFTPYIADIRSAIQEKYADSYLKGVAASDLRIYNSVMALEGGEPVPTCATFSKEGYHEQLLVVVPFAKQEAIQDLTTESELEKLRQELANLNSASVAANNKIMDLETRLSGLIAGLCALTPNHIENA